MIELHQAKERYGVRRFMFFDAVVFSDEAFVLALMERSLEEIGVPFRCVGHVNMLTPALAESLARVGCYSVDFLEALPVLRQHAGVGQAHQGGVEG